MYRIMEILEKLTLMILTIKWKIDFCINYLVLAEQLFTLYNNFTLINKVENILGILL